MSGLKISRLQDISDLMDCMCQGMDLKPEISGKIQLILHNLKSGGFSKNLKSAEFLIGKNQLNF